jgi:hypothetical protein
MRDAQKDIATIAAVRDEFLENKPPSLPHLRNPNLIDEAPLFSEDAQFDSDNCTLTAHFEDPSQLVFTQIDPSFIVKITVRENASLDDPEQVQNALLKLYSRVKYYTNSA